MISCSRFQILYFFLFFSSCLGLQPLLIFYILDFLDLADTRKTAMVFLLSSLKDCCRLHLLLNSSLNTYQPVKGVWGFVGYLLSIFLKKKKVKMFSEMLSNKSFSYIYGHCSHNSCKYIFSLFIVKSFKYFISILLRGNNS